MQCPYDDFQIFMPVDMPKYQDNSARTGLWWSVMYMDDLLISLYCYSNIYS